MKRLREHTEVSSEKAHKHARIEICAICRNSLGEKCIQCEAFPSTGPDPKVCQGYVHSAVCGHGFHVECISRWLDRRPCCPLCNMTWMFPFTLSLAQRAAAKLVDNEMALVTLATAGDLDPSIYAVLDHGPATSTPPGNVGQNALSAPLRRMLGRTFAHYLTEAELEVVMASKRGTKGGASSSS